MNVPTPATRGLYLLAPAGRVLARIAQMRRGVATIVSAALLAGLLAALIAPAQGGAQAPQVCLGDLSGAGVPVEPGPPLRFGINPAGEAGAIGPSSPLT